MCVIELIDVFLPSVARGLISSTTDLVIFSQVLILYFVLVVCMPNLLPN